MSQDIADMPGIDAAMERFNAMDLADGHQPTASATGSNATSASAKTDANASARQSGSSALPGGGSTSATRELTGGSTTGNDAQPTAGRQTGRSALPNNDEAQTSVSSSEASAKGDTSTHTDTPAAAASGNENGKAKIEDGRQAETPSSILNSPSSQQKSRYTKAQERLDKTWEAVNKRKTELDSQASALEHQRLTLERDKAQFETIRRQADQPSATPEQAIQAAQLRRRDADALRTQARRAEDAGRFDEAQRLNKQADKAESLADELTDYSEQLRKNPPVSMQQRQQQFEQTRKQWTVEACNQFPELAKNGSRLQQVVAQHLNALSKQDPQLLVHPSLIFHVARLADAQIAATDLKAVAARVPVLEKETESLRARIKELEADTTPAGNGGVNRLGDEPKDDYASLRQSAAEIGHGRW